MTSTIVHIRKRGLQDYNQCWDEMKNFTNHRDEKTIDEFWIVEHPAVFTQGQNGKPEHILQKKNIPIVATDRGGQVTYHGPGQLVIYTLVDIQRKKFNVRELVSALENSIIQFLAHYQLRANTQCKAPGVYINHKKISSIGLRIRKGRSYHGLALNVDMDLSPFNDINPCGYADLEMTQLKDELPHSPPFSTVTEELIASLAGNLGYTTLLEK